MTVRLLRGARWATLVDHLAREISAAATDPFLTLRVVVSTRATGRVLGQEVAARLGISAGISYLSPADLMRQLAQQAGEERNRSRWLGTPLDLAVADALAQVQHPLVARALAPDDTRPGRRRATAIRIARLLRGYLDHTPQLLASWTAGSDTGLGGAAIPDALSWQPALFRAVTDALELDPLVTLQKIIEAARADTVPTFVIAVDDLTRPQLQAMSALGDGPGLTILQPTGSPGDGWATELADALESLPGGAAAPPMVSVHDSHGEARQVEVLRDELTRAFAEDPSLEPREVAILCPRPERYSALLDSAFAAVDDKAHPGRTLRVQPIGSLDANPVLTLLVSLLRLGRSRATATQIVTLLLSPPIAHRWRLTERRAVVELIAGAGIRWGLDAEHRAVFDLSGVEQNTWVRGIDRLLIGLAVAPGSDVGLGLSGSDAVTASDLSVVGALVEVLARLRRIVAATASPATVPEWVARSRDALGSLVGLPRTDEWQLLHALAVLARFESDHQGNPTELTPHEFAHLLEDAARPPRARVAAGNGTLQVIPLGELQHVEFRVLAMLGVTDDVVPGRGGVLPDSVDLGGHAPDVRTRRLRQLLTHARSAEKLLIVRQASSQRTNRSTAKPVAVSWLLEQLGGSTATLTHPPTATSEANFLSRPSFDLPALGGAEARRASGARSLTITARRRTEARSRQMGPAPAQLTLSQLERFLLDPAKSFLRSAGGITLYAEPQVTDEMPLESGGLEKWQVVNALVDSWKSGTTLESVESYFRQREELPPQRIGDALFQAAKAEAVLLWKSAWGEWSGPVARHAVNLELDLGGAGTVRVVDEVCTRSGFALVATPSRGDHNILRPWLNSLALAAQGIAAPARFHRFVKTQATRYAIAAEATQVDPPTAEDALTHLTTLVGAYAQGQHRLIVVPCGPALTYAREVAAGKFRAADWGGPVGHWKSKWAKPGEAWPLFHADDVRELLTDELLPGDPVNGQTSPFQAWAWELYAPLAKGWS
ncbi:exodeoxyribonuclease V subunit gamma [Tessaracoccus sp. MC1865]|uniref:exodeoxyribonuclease V subunit gamma n=1 Tax=Tessaracoccus sp. MC1865 TaxID=2760310 RepID=UPI0015FEFADA|nr:exodeoxyribonuclease V subunit gamma [Tessaracoccus sp. MC1865]MBB1484928.1 exodeoxyribonuclease V subunit gamma [Tessaracoccus sp. MC1865]QTO38639.1 exodeoxyribonuclease V subunit gamma [Tessaracoccus sp. MC1865]